MFTLPACAGFIYDTLKSNLLKGPSLRILYYSFWNSKFSW